jgi:hypothetical protein
MDLRRGHDHSPFMHIYHKLLRLGLQVPMTAPQGRGERGEGLPGLCRGYGSGMLWALPQQTRKLPPFHVPLPFLVPEAYG